MYLSDETLACLVALMLGTLATQLPPAHRDSSFEEEGL